MNLILLIIYEFVIITFQERGQYNKTTYNWPGIQINKPLCVYPILD